MKLREQISKIRKIINEQSSRFIISGSYNATNCDELHAFQSTGGKVIGNMNVMVLNQIKEWNEQGRKVKPISVKVSVNNMSVKWSVIFEESDVNWIGFTSRGAGCNNSIEQRAGNDSVNNGSKSVIDALSKQGEIVDKIEVVESFTYNGGNNSFKQVFYRYILK